MSKCCIYCRVANESTPAHSAALHNQLLSLRAAAEKLSLEERGVKHHDLRHQ